MGTCRRDTSTASSETSPRDRRELEDLSTSRETFARPRVKPLEETQPWEGEKDLQPLTSCLRRGEVKEPRFYPFKMGSAHGAHALISPAESDPRALCETA